MLSSDHEQLIESKKGAGHCESNDVGIKKDSMHSVMSNDVTGKLNVMEDNTKEQAEERGHEDDKMKVPTACTVVVKMIGKQFKHEY